MSWTLPQSDLDQTQYLMIADLQRQISDELLDRVDLALSVSQGAQNNPETGLRSFMRFDFRELQGCIRRLKYLGRESQAEND